MNLDTYKTEIWSFDDVLLYTSPEDHDIEEAILFSQNFIASNSILNSEILVIQNGDVIGIKTQDDLGL